MNSLSVERQVIQRSNTKAFSNVDVGQYGVLIFIGSNFFTIDNTVTPFGFFSATEDFN